MLDHRNFVAIGKIVKQIGLKGSLKIISLTDFPKRFSSQKEVFLFDEKEDRFSINKFSNNYNFVINNFEIYDRYINLKFENYDSIDVTKELVNLILMINERDRIKLDENNYYYYELIGMEVFNKDNMIGKIESVTNYGSDDLFVIKAGNKEILIPFRKEYIKAVDTQNRRIDADLIEGFLE